MNEKESEAGSGYHDVVISDNAPATTKRAKFAKAMADYGTMYDCTDRTIKKWVRIGKQLDDLPPLDEPTAMAAWWARCMKNKLPAKLLAIARPPEKPVVIPGVEPEPIPRDFSDVRALDIEQNVEQLRHTVAIAKRMLDDAIRGTNEKEVALRQRNYNDSFELLRKAEATLIDLQKHRGNLIDREKIQTEIAQACETLALMRRTMAPRVIGELETILPRRLSRILTAFGPHLAVAIDRVRAFEEQRFRDLASIDGPGALAA